MSELHALTTIPFACDASALLTKLHLTPDTADADDFLALLQRATTIAQPKALLKQCFVEARTEETVTIDGITFTSHTLAMHLTSVHRVFAYVATCGHELDSIPFDDPLTQYWLDAIKSAALQNARQHLNSLFEQLMPGKSASMSPGSGDARLWPITEQVPLFELLGDVAGSIGARLTESLLMLPNKTVSGVRFPAESDFRSCQLCRREVCPNRSAPLDVERYAALLG
ncbi:MAG: hypothetical protein FWD53_11165 [Phycisphaerales bacterium]|nr:hypothetical protein [Phycisphaerales bacterium]